MTAWDALHAHYETIKNVHLRQLFADDAGRGDRMVADGAGLHFAENRPIEGGTRSPAGFQAHEKRSVWIAAHLVQSFRFQHTIDSIR